MVKEKSLKEVILENGWREAWFNDLGNIAKIDSSFWSTILRLPDASYYFTPFYKKDQKSGRRLYLRDLLPVKTTLIKFRPALKVTAALKT